MRAARPFTLWVESLAGYCFTIFLSSATHGSRLKVPDSAQVVSEPIFGIPWFVKTFRH
jgi:hypothetical protein